MKKTIPFFLTAILLAACSKTIQESENLQKPAEETMQKGKPAPPANANPAIAYSKIFKVGNNKYPIGIFVADANGANETRVYTNYSNQYTQHVDFPAWNESGTKLCFTSDFADLYTLNISIVNGIPTGSDATKIANGIAAGGKYKQGKWRPGASQIASVWKKTGETDKIHILPSGGGAAAVLYTAANTDWVIEDDIAFNTDGSKLLFSERQVYTGLVYLQVFDFSSNEVINSIDMSQFKSIEELDWGKTAGTNMAVIITVPKCDATYIGLEGIYQVHTLDVSSSSPSLLLRKDDAGTNLSISPDDSKITVAESYSQKILRTPPECCTRLYNKYEFKIMSLTTGAYSVSFGVNVNNPDWKR